MQCFAITCLYRINMNECQEFFSLRFLTKATINVLIVQQLSINFGWTEFCVLSVKLLLLLLWITKLWIDWNCCCMYMACMQHCNSIGLVTSACHLYSADWVFVTYTISVHLYVSHFRMNLLVKNINGKIAIKMALGLIMMSCCTWTNLASFFSWEIIKPQIKFFSEPHFFLFHYLANHM